MNAPNLELDHIMSMDCALQTPPEMVGVTPAGLRINFYFASGVFSGPLLKGRMRPGGADQFLIRPDGVATIDVRFTLETDDSVLIAASHVGMIDLGPEGYHKALARQLPQLCHGQVAARYEVTEGKYAWLSRVQCAASLLIDRETFHLHYNIYRLRSA